MLDTDVAANRASVRLVPASQTVLLTLPNALFCLAQVFADGSHVSLV